MKANNGSGNIAERDEWETSHELFSKLNKQYQFYFDCCANKINTKCNQFSNNFLCVDKLYHNCWMNPPFSKALEMFLHFFKVVSKGVAIYRCDNLETKIYQEIILPNCDWIFIPKRRVNYISYDYKRPEGMGSRFPSALIGIGLKPPKYIEGICLTKLGG